MQMERVVAVVQIILPKSASAPLSHLCVRRRLTMSRSTTWIESSVIMNWSPGCTLPPSAPYTVSA